MTYQGERARQMAGESGRAFEVSKVRIGGDGRVSAVLWTALGGKSDQAVGARFVVAVADVVDAIHDGARFAAVSRRRRRICRNVCSWSSSTKTAEGASPSMMRHRPGKT